MAESRSKHRRWLTWWPLLLLLACDEDSVDANLSLTADANGGTLLRVDDVCAPECAGDLMINSHLSYHSTGSVQLVKVEIVQYRVDYALPGAASDVPFYGGKTSFEIMPGETKVQSLVAVGSAQRDFVRRATGGAPVGGTGKLTLAGYDEDNHQVFIETGFEVRFSNETGTGAPMQLPADAGSGDGGGGDAGGGDAAK